MKKVLEFGLCAFMALSFSGCIENLPTIGDVIGMPNSSSSSSSSAGTPNTDADFPANSAEHKVAIQAMSGNTWASCIYHHCNTNLDYTLPTRREATANTKYTKLCKKADSAEKSYVGRSGNAATDHQKQEEFLSLCPFDNRYNKSLKIKKYDGETGLGADSFNERTHQEILRDVNKRW
ncbi:MAG: hypothetical protein LUC34_05345 [Campylobacter sp.]|nr:hypothetical protein [Campylobacter sp.]